MANDENQFGFQAEEEQFGFVPEDEEFQPDGDEQAEEMGQAEAALAGAEEGLTFGFSDELAGLMGAGLESTREEPGREEILSQLTPEARQKAEEAGVEVPEISDRQSLLEAYRQYRDEARERQEQAAEQYPKTHFAGSIGGGALIPGSLFAKGLGKGATMGQQAKQASKIGAKAGAIGGAGISEAELTEDPGAEEAGELGLDIATGTGLGGGLGYAMPPAATGAVKMGQKAKRGGEALTDVLLGDPGKAFLQAAKGRKLFGQEAAKEIGGEMTRYGKDIAKKLQDRVQQAAQLKQRILNRAEERGIKLDESEVDEFLKQRLGFEAESRLPQTRREAGELREMARTAKEGPMVRRMRQEEIPSGQKRIAEMEELKAAEQEAIEAGIPREDIETVFEPTDIEGKQAAVVRMAQRDPKTDEITGYRKLASRLIDEEEVSPKFKEVTEKVREEPADLTQLSEAERMRKDLQQRTKYGDFPFKSREVETEASKATQQIRDMIRKEAPGMETADKAIASARKAAEILGADDARAVDPYKTMSKFIQLVEGAEKPGSVAMKSRQLAEDFIGALEEGNERLAREIGDELKEFAKVADVRGHLTKSFTPALAPLQATRLIGTGAGAMAGGAAHTATQTAKSLGKLAPERLQQMAMKAARKGGESSQRLASELARAAKQDRRGRNAIMFGIMQNPQYKELLRDIQGEGTTAPEE